MVRGQIVIVDFRPFSPRAGVRPALVVQNDRDNARMGNTVVVQVTTNLHRVRQDTQLLIDPSHPDWSASGLRHPSAINCSNLYTIEQADVARIIGTLSQSTMEQVSDCLRVVLGLV